VASQKSKNDEELENLNRQQVFVSIHNRWMVPAGNMYPVDGSEEVGAGNIYIYIRCRVAEEVGARNTYVRCRVPEEVGTKNI